MARQRKKRKYVSADQLFADDGPLAISTVLLNWRKCEEWSQVEMAERLGISRQNLCDIEKGRASVSVERAAAWADKLLLPQQLFMQYALQEYVDRSGLTYIVKVSLNARKGRKRKTKGS